jgi:hypothetical protein
MNAKKPSNKPSNKPTFWRFQTMTWRNLWLFTLPSKTSPSTFGRWSTFCDTQEMCPCLAKEVHWQQCT